MSYGEELTTYELLDRLEALHKRVADLQGYPGYTPSATAIADAMLQVVEMMGEIAKRLPSDQPREPGYQ